jgi:hypothetical protein
MAVLTASGCYLPSGLTFGPTNGPEDFQELVYIIFSRRFHQEWFVFLDDLTIASGRPLCLPEGPSEAEDAIEMAIRCEEKTGGPAGYAASERVAVLREGAPAPQGETSWGRGEGFARLGQSGSRIAAPLTLLQRGLPGSRIVAPPSLHR